MTFEEREAIRQIFREELQTFLTMQGGPQYFPPTLPEPGSFAARLADARDVLNRPKRSKHHAR